MHLSNCRITAGNRMVDHGLIAGASPSFVASSQDRDQDALSGGEAGNHTHNWCNLISRAVADAAEPPRGVGGS
jgi:hypothetical protein